MALALLVALLATDLITADRTVLVGFYAAAPVLAAFGGGARATGVVSALAVGGALLATFVLLGDDLSDQDVIRLLSVLVIGVLATWAAVLRRRLERAALRRSELAALLDVIFEGAPIGLVYYDRDLRFARVNRRLEEIDGVPAAEHLGRRVDEVLPEMGPEVPAALRRVLRSGEPVVEIEVTGATPARPGAIREWLTSYWPVRRADGEITGLGGVVLEVTERRAAERALRAQTERYETLLRALSEVGEGMVVLEDGRCVYANPAFEALVGYVAPELAAMDSILDIVVEQQRDQARRRLVEGLAGAGDELRMCHRHGGLVDLEVAAVPLTLDGRREVVVVLRDITHRKRVEAEREAARRRADFLASISEVLDRSLDQDAIAESAARLCVREDADTCVIVVGDSPGLVRHSAVVARDPDREEILRTLQADHPLPADAHPMAEVMRTGRAQLIELPDEALGAIAGDPEHLALLRELGVRTTMLVPLRARGRTLGVLSPGFADLPPEARAHAVRLFEDVARRTALALDNARLYEERSAVARTLQQSLLPPELPAVPGVQLAARYVAAGEGNEVGGDFYDCFSVGDGEWAVLIGDVCGKGAEAATITALARYTIRAAALHTRRPAEVLAELNEAILRQGLDGRFCTVLYAGLRHEDGRVCARLATGGHPLPLVLRADGGVQTAGAPGSLLGILPEPRLTERTVELEPGDALVLYTDGVIETSPADDAFGPEPFAAFLGTLRGRDAAAIAAGIERAALDRADPPGQARDDVAVVVVRALEPAPTAPPFDPEAAGVAAPA